MNCTLTTICCLFMRNASDRTTHSSSSTKCRARMSCRGLGFSPLTPRMKDTKTHLISSTR
uniref:Uncharacterized protein n=1 Tax=Rhizophora mucronata TaxID=61149 RepID=A0A2P2Q3Y8_RHIMU